MGRRGTIGDLFRLELKGARIRHGLTQAQLSDVINERYDLGIHPTTIAKIESGGRDVRVDELFAFAELFGVSTDVLLGRNGTGTDVMWAASKLTTNARKVSVDLAAIRERFDEDIIDLEHTANREHKYEQVSYLLKMAGSACALLNAAVDRMASLAGEFPLPGLNLDRDRT